MSWENRFSTMVRQSSAKIDEAKHRLHRIDTSSLNTVGIYADHSSWPTTLQSDNIQSLSDPSSVTLLHMLCQKLEMQSQTCDLLKSKVQILEASSMDQQKEMEVLKGQLAQVSQKMDTYKTTNDEQALEEWKTEMKSELNKINQQLHQKEHENDDLAEFRPTSSKRNESPVPENEFVVNSLSEIKKRLDTIELELSNYHRDAENNSKIVDKNTKLLTDWKNSNAKSLERLCRMHDLSADEVKHVRTILCSIQDKVDELETAISDVRLHDDKSTVRPKSNSFFDDYESKTPESRKPSKLHHISVSSEDGQTSLSGSSLNLDVSDNSDLALEIDELNLEQGTRKQRRPQSSTSDTLESSLDSFSGSEHSLSDI